VRDVIIYYSYKLVFFLLHIMPMISFGYLLLTYLYLTNWA